MSNKVGKSIEFIMFKCLIGFKFKCLVFLVFLFLNKNAFKLCMILCFMIVIKRVRIFIKVVIKFFKEKLKNCIKNFNVLCFFF